MTNAEAIETLRANYPDACYEQLREAVDAAIEALKAQDAAGDTISRQVAINALTSHIMPHNNEDGTVTIGVLSKSSIKNILNKLPSAQPDMSEYSDKLWKAAYERGKAEAQPERKKGKWNFIGDQMFECSECGTYYTQSQFHQMRVRISDTEFPKFCPNCGADMREPEDIPMEYFESGGR